MWRLSGYKRANEIQLEKHEWVRNLEKYLKSKIYSMSGVPIKCS